MDGATPTLCCRRFRKSVTTCGSATKTSMPLYPALGPAQRFKRYIKQKTSVVDSVATSCHVSPTIRISGLCSAILICNSAMLDIRHITFTETIRTVAMLEVKRCLPQCPGFTTDVGQGKTKSLSAMMRCLKKLSRERARLKPLSPTGDGDVKG